MSVPASRRAATRAAARLGPGDLLRLAEVTALVGLVEIGVRCVPIDRLAGWLGVTLRRTGADGPEGNGVLAADFSDAELRRARLAHKVLAHWPLAPGPCLRESLVIGHALRRHRPVLRLGVARAGDAVVAHAWLEVGGVSLEADRGFLPLEL